MVVDAPFPLTLKRRKLTSIDSMEAETAKVLFVFFFFPRPSPFARFSWFLIYVLVQLFVFDIGSIWVLSKMVYLCFNFWILGDSGCGFGSRIVCVFQIGVVLFLLFRFLESSTLASETESSGSFSFFFLIIKLSGRV